MITSIPPKSQLTQEWNNLPIPGSPCSSNNLYETALKNSSKNRYSDILPFESTRVILNDPNEYINANYIRIPGHYISYIATQAPLQNTFDTFWKMIWEKNVPVIIMLTKILEGRRIKAARYWGDLNKPEFFCDGKLSVTLLEEKIKGFLIKRKFNLSLDGETKIITHIQYTEWPDYGVPKSTDTLQKLANFVLSFNKEEMCNINIVVHCSAGIGRCGTFLAILAAVKSFNHNNSPKNITIYDIVSNLRKSRMQMVQTKEQYQFIYKVVSDFLNKDCKNTTPLINKLRY